MVCISRPFFRHLQLGLRSCSVSPTPPLLFDSQLCIWVIKCPLCPIVFSFMDHTMIQFRLTIWYNPNSFSKKNTCMVCWALLLSANEKNESCVEAWAGVPSPAQDVLRASRRYTSNASSSRDGPKLSCVWLEERQDTAILQICLLCTALCWHVKKYFWNTTPKIQR